MGLDMYLTGEKFFWTDWKDDSKNRKEDRIQVESLCVKLGYWRKHPNLHGYIVNTFAEGKDECQRIDLEADDLRKIIDAVRSKDLPPTDGFFFGQSYMTDEEAADDIRQLEAAIKWLETKEEKISRCVFYRASW